MVSVIKIAKSLKADPKREAVDSIRGYDWQRWLTVELWLGLIDEERVWIELGEDITVNRSSEIETIQAKDLSSPISLGQKKIQKIIDRALLRNANVITTIWTTADLVVERLSKFPEPGIRYWKRAIDREVEVALLTDFIASAANISAEAKAKFTAKSIDECLAILGKIQWVSSEVNLEGLRARILPQIESRLLQLKVTSAGTLREVFAEFLFALVAKVAVQKSVNNRSLTRVDLDQVILDTFARFANASLPTVLSDVTNVIDGYIGGLPSNLVDKEIQSAVGKLRKSRFFAGFDLVGESRKLATRIMNGDLRTGSPQAKGIALSWAARLVDCKNSDERIELNSIALSWDTSEETLINAMFIRAEFGDTGSALRELNEISTSAARTAMLMIYGAGREQAEQIQWISDAGMSFSDFDGEGKTYLLIQALQNSDWDQAVKIFATVTDADIDSAPTLALLGGQTKLAQAIDPDLREAGLSFLPMNLSGFPLANDANGLENIRGSKKLFERGAEFCNKLSLHSYAAFCSDFALWLELRDPSSSAQGLARLRDSFSVRKTGLRRVNFALRFGMQIDRQEILAEANRELAITVNTSLNAIFAKFLLEVDAGIDVALAKFIDDERELLRKAIEPTALVMFEVQALANAGFFDRAEKVLNEFEATKPTASAVTDLRRFIAERAGEDPVRLRKAAYQASGTVQNLAMLVDALQAVNDLPQMIEYGTLLFNRVKSLQDAEMLVRAMKDNKANASAYEFLASNQDFVEQSNYLRASWCEQLYLRGSIAQAQELVETLRAQGDQPCYRRLAARIAITAGNWGALATIVDDVWKQRDKLSAQEVFFAAKIARSVASTRQFDLIATGAATNGGSDPAALLTAYHLAVQSGVETPETAAWLNAAIALSGEDGPVKQVSLQEIVDLAPGWRERQSQAAQWLREGLMPMFAVASSLNSSLGGFILLRALGNSEESDLRAKATIYAYSGQRNEVAILVKSIGLDGTALLTMELLGITDLVFAAFDSIHIPHTTLGWLFEERDRIQFHQPRRMRDAEKLRNLIAETKLYGFVASMAPPPRLVNDVGYDFAAMLNEALVSSNEETRYVVTWAPVHKVGSLIAEEADLSSYRSVLISAAAIVDRLQNRGAITALEAEDAQRYLSSQGVRWPNEPSITGDVVLYLDNVSISHLMHLGLLGKLSVAGMKAYLTPHEAEEGLTMLRHQELVVKANGIIEGLRSKLHSGIRSGLVKIGQRPERGSTGDTKGEDEDDVDDGLENDSTFRVHPTISIFDLVADVEAVVVDDRFLNMHHRMDFKGKSVPLYTTYDLIEFLRSQSKISPSHLAHLKTKLRRFGYQFLPLTELELAAAVEASQVVDGHLSPSAELMAIRDSILQARISSSLLLPEEAKWLTGLIGTFAQVIKGQWRTGADGITAIARCTWLVQFMDMRDWAMCFRDRTGAHLAGGVPLFVALLMRVDDDMEDADVKQYFQWLEDTVLNPMKHTNPRDYGGFLQYFDQLVRHSVEQVVEMSANG